MKKRILFVCLGNICRSPAAEGVFRHLITKKGVQDDYFVDSAGTGGWHVGNQADKRMRNAASKRGVKIESIARQIKLEDFHSFDLILTMDNDNLATMISFAQQAGSNLTVQIKPILSYANNLGLIEVPDPYYGGDKGFDNVLDMLEVSCEGLLKELSLKG